MSKKEDVGQRRVRVDLKNFGIQSTFTIKLNLDHLTGTNLSQRADIYADSVRQKLTNDIVSYFESNLKSLEKVASKLDETSKNNFLWNFKLEITNDSYSQNNVFSILDRKFNKAKKEIEAIIKRKEGKKVITEWLSKNPYLETFKMARLSKREFIFHMGPTNSGKTYEAIQDLKKAKSGCYLAPLRLLAHEIYDELNKDGTYCSLVTGEERIYVPNNTVVSSTVEMANFNKNYDVSIIDEIQMITDPHRGWAWTQAVCGLSSDKIYLAGSGEVLPILKILIEDVLGETLTVKEFTRKNPLEVEDEIFDLEKSEIYEGDAFIVFSRNRVFELKQNFDGDCSVIYGSLSPDVRKSEARKFRDKENPIVISTDAIGMGLNLPISRIIFMDTEKYNGITKTRPDPQLIKQIAGRAGRYGHCDSGLVTSTNDDFRKYIKKCLSKETVIQTKGHKFSISPNLELLKVVSESLDTTNLNVILNEIKDIFEYDDVFTLMNIDNMSDASKVIHPHLDLEVKFAYSCAPINLKSERDRVSFSNWSRLHHNGKTVTRNSIPDVKNITSKDESDVLWIYENQVKLLSCYIWLSQRYPEIYTDVEEVNIRIKKINDKIMKILDQS